MRARVLREAGFAPEIIVSGVDEDDVTGSSHDVALVLAERKAGVVADRLEGAPALVLGCDTVLDVGGEIRGKPASLDQARAWWASVAGRSAVLHSGLCVLDMVSGCRSTGMAATIVHYGQPSEREMDAYLATGEPLTVAGGFTIIESSQNAVSSSKPVPTTGVPTGWTVTQSKAASASAFSVYVTCIQ